jgi:hypothetical protein
MHGVEAEQAGKAINGQIRDKVEQQSAYAMDVV